MWILAAAATADLVLLGGRVQTVDPALPRATALAVQAGRVVSVGTDDEVRRLAGPKTRVVQLDGRTVVPGLVDTHTHAYDAARARVLGWLDLGLPAARSLADARDAVAQSASAGPPGGWVLGDRWDESKWPERRSLTRADLDPVTGERPLYLEHVSGHKAVVNGAALRRAGITRATPDPVGGAVEKDAAGEPTGVLKDTAMDLVTRHLPQVEVTAEQRLAIAERATSEAASFGLTTIHDSALSAEAIQAYREAARAGRLRARVRMNPLLTPTGFEATLRELAAEGAPKAGATPLLRWGAVKVFTDGGMAARTIAVSPPGTVDDPGNLGLMRWETPALVAAFRAARAAGWPITAHAIGDRAIAQVLDAVEQGLGASPGDHRTRIVHCGVTTPEILDRIRRLGVYVDHNPAFVYWIGDWFRNYGPERAATAYRGRSYEDRGIVVSAGSDVGVTPISPWWGLWAAVERKEYLTGDVLGPAERVDAATALKWYTASGARAGFDEGELGRLAPGLAADFLILDRDPLSVPAAELKDVKVLATYVAGVPVYEAAR
jgi:predicted amidohydrolase YtcJ